MCSKGFEPPTHGLEGRCSIQLSYEHTCIWINYNAKAGDNKLIIDGVEYPIFKDPKTDRETGDGFKKSQRGACRVFWRSKLDKEITYEDGLTYEESLVNNLMVPIFRDGKFLEGAEVTLNDVRKRLNPQF